MRYRLPYLAGIISVVGGLITVLGWEIGSDRLKDPFGTNFMAPNTALCLITGGAALVLLQSETRNWRRVLGLISAAFVSLAGVVTTLEYITGADFGIDRLFLGSKLAAWHAPNVLPGRFAPNTAVAFLFLGLALLALPLRTRLKLSESFVLPAGFISFLSIVGYAYNSRPLYGVGSFSYQALHTALYIGILCIGILFTQTDRGVISLVLGEDIGGVAARRLLLLTVIALPLLGWIRLRVQQKFTVEPEFATALLVITAVALFAFMVVQTGYILRELDLKRKRAEANLQSKDDEIVAIFEASPIAIVLMDVDRRIWRWNPAAEKLFGWTSAEMIGKTLPLPPEQEAQWTAISEQLRQGRQVTGMLTRRSRKDGSVFDAAVSGMPLRDSGRVPRFVGIVEDVTERVQAEEERRQADERMRLALHSGQAGAFEWDLVQGVHSWSPEMEELYGLERGSFAGTYEAWQSRILPEDQAGATGAAEAALKTGELAGEWRIKRANDGRIRWLSARGKVFYDAAGKPARLIGINSDITARKEIEEALSRSHAELESLIDLRTAALRRLSARLLQLQDEERRKIARELHDGLGQYLAALGINIERLIEQPTDGSEILLESREILQTTIAEIRTLSHLLHPPLLDEVGFSSAARWYVEGFAKRSGVEVNLDLPANLQRLPETIEITLFRALQETLINIHRHSGSKRADIQLRIEGDVVMLQIQDFGHGISTELLGSLQSSGTASGGVGLTGLRERTAELRGRMEIRSDGEGTLVSVTLPLHAPDFPSKPADMSLA